jgi:hypothetical protein
MALGGKRNSLELEIQTASEHSSRQISNLDGDIETSGQHLELSDGGAAAWRLLLAAFVFEALLWGKARKFFYSLNLPFFFDIIAYKMAKASHSRSESSKIITLSFPNLPITPIYLSSGPSRREYPIWALL